MLCIEEIAIGIVAWPDPSFFTSQAGCALPYSVHRSLHPMVCIEKNETHGVWIGLSSKAKTLGGRIKMEIPKKWKIGSSSWIERPSFVGDLTTSMILPHKVMIQATEKAEIEGLRRHRLTASGAAEILHAVQRAEGYTFKNNPLVSHPMPNLSAKIICKGIAATSVVMRDRLTKAEYKRLLDKHGRGATIEELSKEFRFPVSRVRSYIYYRSRRDETDATPSAGNLDLSKVSLSALKAAVAKKEKDVIVSRAETKLARLASRLGVSISKLELAPKGARVGACEQA